MYSNAAVPTTGNITYLMMLDSSRPSVRKYRQAAMLPSP